MTPDDFPVSTKDQASRGVVGFRAYRHGALWPPTVVPSDSYCVPAHFGDAASVIGIASPINAATLLEAFRFGGSHRTFLILTFHRQLCF